MALTKVRGSGLGTINTADLDGAVTINESSADVDFRVESNGNANMLVVDAGNDRVGIGTNTPDFPLDIEGSVADDAVTTVVRISADDPAASGEHAELQIKCGNGASDTATRRVELHALSNNGADNRNLCLNPSGGNVIIGGTDQNLSSTDGDEKIIMENDGDFKMQGASKAIMTLNRNGTDGTILLFQHENSSEGSISSSGSTISYDGFAGRHESSGIPTDTEKGTVLSTIDELDIYPTKQESMVEKGEGESKVFQDHPRAGQTREDHAKVKISDSVGDKRVYGVVDSFTIHDKLMVASVGIGSIKVTGACEGGDLLESNGDGTAKVQSDDVIRSKTIGKVTIGNSDTGVKLVSCVLYCG